MLSVEQQKANHQEQMTEANSLLKVMVEHFTLLRVFPKKLQLQRSQNSMLWEYPQEETMTQHYGSGK